jgi:ribosomal protein S18 acetylase RimI-like enzyme
MTPYLLPEGYTTRPATEDDAEIILGLLVAVSTHFVGEIEETIEEIREELTDPHADLPTRTLLIFDPAGTLVGYGAVFDFERRESPILDIYSLPDAAIGTDLIEGYLLAWAEAICAANLPLVPAEHRVAMRAWSYSHDPGYNGMLEKFGFVDARVSYQMRIQLPDEPLPRPALPDGFTLRFVTQDEDWTELIRTIRETWKDHFGYVHRPDEVAVPMWQRHLEHIFQPDAWLVAMQGDEIAGFLLIQMRANGYDDFAWINLVGTPRQFRKQGIAEALLRNAFAICQAQGMKRVGLGVDGQSLTGATRLYEKVGMHVHLSYRMNEKVLREGIDITVSQLEA